MWLRFDATTLWHSDAAEWAPSTASLANRRPEPSLVGFWANTHIDGVFSRHVWLAVDGLGRQKLGKTLVYPECE
jgi:hypothetical protein